MPDWHGLVESAQPVELRGEALRLVESQEQVATASLVSTLAHQAVLEQMLEEVKPPRRRGSERLHYLLATPFRYPPLRHGSRFGRRSEPGLFYGGRTESTVLAEAAFYRFHFWYGMTTPPPARIDTQHTLFAARYRSSAALQLHQPPFDAYRALLTHPADYRQTQALGSALREADIELFQFTSARDPRQGLNVALFTPRPFIRRAPVRESPWLCQLTADRVRFRGPLADDFHEFPLETFLVNGELPLPA
ncbi:MAG: RES family NAD+ phosphorylase [Ectothiorhodospiraceae bacterium]|nr:RES family NAD+ phosphorylase [Ectothiorhodospiraceae bacterium]